MAVARAKIGLSRVRNTWRVISRRAGVRRRANVHPWKSRLNTSINSPEGRKKLHGSPFIVPTALEEYYGLESVNAMSRLPRDPINGAFSSGPCPRRARRSGRFLGRRLSRRGSVWIRRDTDLFEGAHAAEQREYPAAPRSAESFTKQSRGRSGESAILSATRQRP